MDAAERRWNFLKEFNVGKYERAKKEKLADKPIIPLCDFLNSKPNYFTSSSCSGRILVIDVPSKDKREAVFLKKWHSGVGNERGVKEIKSIKGKIVWLRFDPFIIHISCRTLEDAQLLLKIKWDSGIRRGGIHTISEGRHSVELEGSENMAVPIMLDGKFIADQNFLMECMKIANTKMKENRKRFLAFEKNIYERLG